MPYVGEVWNLSVEGSESYTAEGMAVHNCFAAMIAMRVHIEWPMLATGLPPRMLLDQLPQEFVEENPWAEKLGNAENQVWNEVDEQRARLREASGRNLHEEYLLPDPSRRDRVPDIPW